MATTRSIAFFITPHGYGHAARAAAVMLAMQQAQPGTHFEIFTRVPQWFFEVTLGSSFGYHECASDIGLVQDSVMDENLPETVRRLGQMMPFSPALLTPLVEQIKALGCEMVMCDVSPLGIAVAKAAGLPAVLEENFTWDWIYEGYLGEEPGLAPYIAYLREVFASADKHIITEPACSYHLPADLITGVVGRRPRTPAAEIRAELGVPDGRKLVLVTMGGIGSNYPFLDRLEDYSEACFVVPGGSTHFEQRGSLILLAHHSQFYHPDLVAASDAVVGKLGYSTLAETYQAGIPFAFIPRPRFRESDVMKHFVLQKMDGIELSDELFYAGAWLDVVPQLLAIPKVQHSELDGAQQIAEFLS